MAGTMLIEILIMKKLNKGPRIMEIGLRLRTILNQNLSFTRIDINTVKKSIVSKFLNIKQLEEI